MNPELGVIEGFYGKPWSWEEREATVRFLAAYGYRFYLYAPKADPYLRRQWQDDHPVEIAARLKTLAAACQVAGVRFGVGLSPYEAYADYRDVMAMVEELIPTLAERHNLRLG